MVEDVSMTGLSHVQELEAPLGRVQKMFLRRVGDTKGQVMTTPCQHSFHAPCLMQWMNVRMECPICRTQLPPLD